jgi:hypothetical protein
MTMYTEPLIDQRPFLLKRAAELVHQTTLPEEALIKRLQAPPSQSRLAGNCARLHRKWTTFPLLVQQDPLACLLASMSEVTNAKGAGTLGATIALDDSWGFGAAVLRIAHDVVSSVRRISTARDEVPTLEAICSEAESGEVSLYAPYAERVLGYVLSPARLTGALRELEQLRQDANAVSALDTRRLVVFAFDHLLSRCLLPLANVMALDVPSDSRVYILAQPDPRIPTAPSWPPPNHVAVIGPGHVFVRETGTFDQSGQPQTRLSLTPDRRTPARLRLAQKGHRLLSVMNDASADVVLREPDAADTDNCLAEGA